MDQAAKTCQCCKKEFIIEPEDFSYYQKINVPPPSWCPRCRMLRRMSFFNLSSFYKRACDKCGKRVISLHEESRPYKMYCHDCWWSDDWDGTEYGMDYDENRSFFDQLIELRDKSVFMSLESLHPSNVRTEYTNNSSYQKDCFMTMFADYLEYCAYVTLAAHVKDSLDCYRMEESEKCYECVGAYKSFNCYWCEEIDSCLDCAFSRACYGCSHCIGCINLRSQSFCIFNKQYSQSEYYGELERLNLGRYEQQQEFKKKVEEFWLKFPRRAYQGNSLNVNVSGDYIYESKNTKDSFLVFSAENSRFLQYITLPYTKDCYDYTGWGANSELLYECFIVGEGAYDNKFCSECWPDPSGIEYSFFAVHAKNCFGCVNLKKKSFCILNKQYSKEDYIRLKRRILEKMKNETWVSKANHSYAYGEFLPPELSPYSYHETMAYEYELLSKEEAQKRGFNWYETPKTVYSPTISSSDLPSVVSEIGKDISAEVIQCSACDKAYNLTPMELDLLGRFNQPPPHSCPSCRHRRRFDKTNKPVLYDRTCDKCNTPIKTSYHHSSPEIVYCVKCYQAEFL